MILRKETRGKKKKVLVIVSLAKHHLSSSKIDAMELKNAYGMQIMAHNITILEDINATNTQSTLS